MKLGATKYWRLQNIGNPSDDSIGQGNIKDLAEAMIEFWGKVTMAKHIKIELFRSMEDRDARKSLGKTATKQDELDELFAGINLDAGTDEEDN